MARQTVPVLEVLQRHFHRQKILSEMGNGKMNKADKREA